MQVSIPSWLTYSTILGISYAVIVAGTVGYLRSPPKYETHWTMVLPGNRLKASVQVNGIDEASSSYTSVFHLDYRSPVMIYKALAGNQAIIDRAAESLDMSREDYGKPKLKTIEEVAIIKVRQLGSSPEEANQKAQALWNAIQQHLDMLRTREIAIKHQTLGGRVVEYKSRLDTTTQHLLNFKKHSDLATSRQFVKLTQLYQNLQRELINAEGDYQQQLGLIQSYRTLLGMSEQQAKIAILLHADRTFRYHWNDYAEATALFEQYAGVLGNNHPKIKMSRNQQLSARHAMQQRGLKVGGDDHYDTLVYFLGAQDATKLSLFSDLIRLYGQLESLEISQQTIASQVDRLAHKVQLWVEDATILKNLEREHELAQSIYSGVAGRVEILRADIHSTYPLVHLLDIPQVDAAPASPSPVFGVWAGIVIAFCVSIGWGLFWTRNNNTYADDEEDELELFTPRPIAPSSTAPPIKYLPKPSTH